MFKCTWRTVEKVFKKDRVIEHEGMLINVFRGISTDGVVKTLAAVLEKNDYNSEYDPNIIILEADDLRVYPLSLKLGV